jgi:hypothetical protein
LNLAYSTDKRRYIRYELLDYAVMSIDGQSESFNIVITDIGLGGIQIRTKHDLPSGTKCLVHVGSSDGGSIDLRGEIRHATTVPNSDIQSAGVRFVPENHAERMSVAEFVHQIFQRQAEELSS